MNEKRTPWYGVDLDGTLAEYHGWKGRDHIGPPVPEMVKRVTAWIAEGKTVKIFTARMCDHTLFTDCLTPIQNWCLKHIGMVLDVTHEKDFAMVELWDDRCVQVVKNTGERVGDELGLQRVKEAFSGSLWVHVATGRLYVVVGACQLVAPDEAGVLYCDVNDPNGLVWTRAEAEFLDGRFERFEEGNIS